MKRLLLKLALMALPFSAYANLGEMFGADAITSSLGNQADDNPNNPANNFYNPSLLGFSEKLNISLGTTYVNTQFNEIKDVRIRNTVTHTNGDLEGNIDTNYGDSAYFNIHLSLPILNRTGAKLGITIFTPVGKLMETNTGDPFQTEYVMYRARYNRTVTNFNLAYPFTSNWAASIGVYTGLQVSARAYTRASLSSSSNVYSYGRLKSKAKPSIAGIFSTTYKNDWTTHYLYFQQEMKSELKTLAIGETENPNVPFDLELNSLMFYDPMIARYGSTVKLGSFSTTFTAEYQFWENFEAPTLNIKQRSGSIKGSQSFENIKTQNIFVPKLGFGYALSDDMNMRLGFIYRPTPLKGDFSGSGNTVDTDVYIVSAGGDMNFKLFGHKIQLMGSAQYHHLKEIDIQKSTGLEDGTASGEKVGHPGYKVGGYVLVAQGGMKLEF